MSSDKPQVILYSTGLSKDSVTIATYEAKVTARSWQEAEELLNEFLAKEIPPQINGRSVKGFGFCRWCETPKPVLQWFMDLILGQQSERDFYYSVYVHCQRLDRAKV